MFLHYLLRTSKVLFMTGWTNRHIVHDASPTDASIRVKFVLCPFFLHFRLFNCDYSRIFVFNMKSMLHCKEMTLNIRLRGFISIEKNTASLRIREKKNWSLILFIAAVFIQGFIVSAYASEGHFNDHVFSDWRMMLPNRVLNLHECQWKQYLWNLSEFWSSLPDKTRK